MTSSFAAAFIALQLSAGASTDSFPHTYLDPGARHLVESARTRRSTVEGRIEQYTTLARSRVSIGFRALRRDRTFYRCEAASRIEWQRGDTIFVDLLGAREVVPMFSGEVRPGNGDCGGGLFDPTADRLAFALGGGMSKEDSSFLRHPLAVGSERDYRFRSGDTTAMRLADGTVIRLLELQMLPRRSEPFLVSGSLWLEDRSYAVVRATLRLARPFDYERDFESVREEEGEDEEEELPGFLRPLRADIRYVSIEYGLWEQQWWLPRLVAFEGEAEVGRLLSVPLRMERVYDSYRVAAFPQGAPLPELPELPPDSVCGDGNEEDEDGGEETGVGEGDAEGNRGSEGGDSAGRRTEVRIAVGDDEAAVDESRSVGCECSGDRCQVVVTRAVVDSAELINSDFLPHSIHADGNVLLSDREMEDLLARVEEIPRAPWQLAPITWRTGLQGFDLVRYNRVEGLSLGAAANLALGGASVDGTLRVGVADLTPAFELAVARNTVFSIQRIGAYGRLDAVGPGQGMMGLGSSLTALLFGRDDADYYRAWGVEVSREPARSEDGLSWRAFAELQRSAEKHTDFSFANALGEAEFRPNIEADRAEQVGVRVALAGSRGADPTSWRGAVTGAVLGSTGTFSFVQPRVMLRGAAPLPFDLLSSLELNGATSFGEVPRQSLYYLGGGRTVRGYEGNSARGETYWTARAEIATAAPGARVVLFSDAGWAGPREELTADPLLLSAGAGISFLDGILRFDIARALRELPGGEGWRVELQVDAGL